MIVRVRSELALDAIVQHCPARSAVQVRGNGDEITQCDRLAVQEIRRPIGCLIGTVPPDRANLLTTDGLPDLLAVEDVLAREQRSTALIRYAGGYRRCFPIDLHAEAAEYQKCAHDAGAEKDPKASTRRHQTAPAMALGNSTWFSM